MTNHLLPFTFGSLILPLTSCSDSRLVAKGLFDARRRLIEGTHCTVDGADR